MCVALPGRVVEVVDTEHHIVRVEVAGETHEMSAALLADEGVAPGDWVEIHMGHAYVKLTEEEAHQMLDFMDELDAAHRGQLERLEDELDERTGADAPADATAQDDTAARGGTVAQDDVDTPVPPETDGRED